MRLRFHTRYVIEIITHMLKNVSEARLQKPKRTQLTIYGTISKYTTKRWSYNDDIKLKIKDIQAKAIKKGKAEQVESIVIKYTPPKGL